MTKRLHIIFLIILTSFFSFFIIATIAIGFSSSPNSKDNKKMKYTMSDITKAKLFDFKDNVSNKTSKWWHNIIYNIYPSSYQESYVQKQKYNYLHNSYDEGYSNVNNSLDLEWYSTEKTDNNDHFTKPLKYTSEYYGNYQGSRNDLFGFNFGLIGNLTYSLETRYQNDFKYGWNYTFNTFGADYFPNVISSEQDTTSPEYVHNDKTTLNYLSQNKYDFAYYYLWNLGLLSPGKIDPDTHDYPNNIGNRPAYKDQLSLVGHTKIDNTGKTGDDIDERKPLESSFSTDKYNIITFCVPIEKFTSVVVTEYSPKDPNNHNIYLLRDTLWNNDNIYLDNNFYTDEGYRFDNYMLPYWKSSTDPLEKDKLNYNYKRSSFSSDWDNYIEKGVFPVHLTKTVTDDKTKKSKIVADDDKTYEVVRSRYKFETENKSADIAKKLYSYNKYSEINPITDTSSDFGYNFITNNVKRWHWETPNEYLAKDNQYDNKKTIKYINYQNLEYYFLLLHGPTQNSSDKTDDKDSYNSYSPFNYYITTISTRMNSDFTKTEGGLTQYIVSSTSNSGSSNNTDSSPYLYESAIKYVKNDDNQFVIQKLPYINQVIFIDEFPTWIIVLICLVILIILGIGAYLYFKFRTIKSWKKDKFENSALTEDEIYLKFLRKKLSILKKNKK